MRTSLLAGTATGLLLLFGSVVAVKLHNAWRIDLVVLLQASDNRISALIAAADGEKSAPNASMPCGEIAKRRASLTELDRSRLTVGAQEAVSIAQSCDALLSANSG